MRLKLGMTPGVVQLGPAWKPCRSSTCLQRYRLLKQDPNVLFCPSPLCSNIESSWLLPGRLVRLTPNTHCSTEVVPHSPTSSSGSLILWFPLWSASPLKPWLHCFYSVRFQLSPGKGLGHVLRGERLAQAILSTNTALPWMPAKITILKLELL